MNKTLRNILIAVIIVVLILLLLSSLFKITIVLAVFGAGFHLGSKYNKHKNITIKEIKL